MTAKSKLYDPADSKGFPISRSKIELFVECPRCFYLDRRCGIRRVSGPRFTLNLQVDELLKREFDHYRHLGNPHPLMTHSGIDAVPFSHPDLERWRHAFTGIRHLHAATGLSVFGGVDDVWVRPDAQLLIVDYKAKGPGKTLANDSYGATAYKRQLEVYQWLFRKNGFPVYPTGYLLYASCKSGRRSFDARLEFDLTIYPCDCDDGWIDETLVKVKACLDAVQPPPNAPDCAHCRYRAAQTQVADQLTWFQ